MSDLFNLECRTRSGSAAVMASLQVFFWGGNFKFVHAAYGLMIVPWMQPRSKNCNFQLSCPTRLVENIGQAPPGSGSATDMVGLQDFLKIVSIFCMPPTV